MVGPQVVTNLIERQSRLTGETKKLEGQLGQARTDLAHIDATICIFDPIYDPELIAAKKMRERSGWFEKNHLLRLVLDTLRAVPEPVTIRQVSLPRAPITSAARSSV